jgi:hypothetical protein
MESSRHALLPIYAIRLTFPHLAIGRFWRKAAFSPLGRPPKGPEAEIADSLDWLTAPAR